MKILSASQQSFAESKENVRGEFPFGQNLEIKAYLSNSHPSARYRLAKKTGFYTCPDGSNLFALPTQIIGNSSDEEVYFQTDCNSNSIRQMGTLSDWQEYVAKPVSGNPILIFSLAVSFASPLLKMLGSVETGGFHLHGTTSRGKTTGLMVGASSWGNAAPPSNNSGDSFINTWKIIGNELEGIAAARNDIFLAIDELGQADADDVSRIAYDLSSGSGKERLPRNATLAEKKQWRVIYLSTGEISAREVMESSNAQVKAGNQVRLIDIDIEDEIIQDSHGQSSVDFVDGLRKNCATYFGSAGPMFVAKLIETTNTPQGQEELEDDYQQCFELLAAPFYLDGEQLRVVCRFALVLLAGIYAVKYKIIPLCEDEIIDAVQAHCSRWINSSESLVNTLIAIKNIQAFLTANNSRFQDLDSENTVPSHSLLGYRKLINGEPYYLFPAESFNKAVKNSHHRSLLRKLTALGLLHINNGDRNQARFNIPGSQGAGNSSKLSFYAISADILTYGQEVQR